MSSKHYNRARRKVAASACMVVFICASHFLSRAVPAQSAPSQVLSKTEFEIIEGIFHDGLGTYAELVLANALIEKARLDQPRFDLSASEAKLNSAIERLPSSHPSREVFKREIDNIRIAVRRGAEQLLEKSRPSHLVRIRHTAREFSGARAGDLRLELSGRDPLPISVKTDKSRKVAVTEGQTPHIGKKWAERYFQVSGAELEEMIAELGFKSQSELRSHYLNVARLVAHVLVRKLVITNFKPTDFSQAKAANIDAVKYLFRQLQRFKRGNDASRVIIFDRSTGEVRWESRLDAIDIDSVTADRITFLPSRPRAGNSVASEFGIKVDGETVVSFQIKHKRGKARDTSRQYEFSDITTRLRI